MKINIYIYAHKLYKHTSTLYNGKGKISKIRSIWEFSKRYENAMNDFSIPQIFLLSIVYLQHTVNYFWFFKMQSLLSVSFLRL